MINELAHAEDMAYFRTDLCPYSPEGYSLEEKEEICNDMTNTRKEILSIRKGNRLFTRSQSSSY